MKGAHWVAACPPLAAHCSFVAAPSARQLLPRGPRPCRRLRPLRWCSWILLLDRHVFTLSFQAFCCLEVEQTVEILCFKYFYWFVLIKTWGDRWQGFICPATSHVRAKRVRMCSSDS